MHPVVKKKISRPISAVLSFAFFFALFFVAHYESTAAAEPSTPLLKRLESAQVQAGKRENLALSFQQEVFTTSGRGKTRKSSGTLLFMKPNFFRWEVNNPKKEVYVNNEKDLWKYQEATKHAQRMAPGSVDLDFIDLVLKLNSLSKRYEVTEWTPGPEANPKTVESKEVLPMVKSAVPPKVADSEKESTLFLTLKPKEDIGQDQIYAVLNEKQSLITELRIFYTNGNRTRIVFSEMENKPVKRATFDFAPPPGTAVDKM